MIEFENEVHDDVESNCLQRWAETPLGRVRCRATYSFIEDRFGFTGKEELLARASEAFDDLKPLYEDAIGRADFAQGRVKTIEFS